MGRMGHDPHSSKAARRRADTRGRAAEIIALFYLMLTGHRILARRWRGSAGEIDLVARRRRRIIFVEVKFRHGSDAPGIPTGRQRRRIIQAAQQFCRERRISAEFEQRFDLIQISPSFGGMIFRIRHIRDAWWAETG